MANVAFSTPGFMEIIVLVVLALLIFGPERLPGMARNAGRMLAQFKREASSTVDELKRHAEIEELRGVANELRSTGAELRSTGSEVRRTAALAAPLAGSDPQSTPDAPAPEGGPPPFDPDAT